MQRGEIRDFCSTSFNAAVCICNMQKYVLKLGLWVIKEQSGWSMDQSFREKYSIHSKYLYP